ncbi:MAG: histidine kinase [Mycobacterium sp.]
MRARTVLVVVVVALTAALAAGDIARHCSVAAIGCGIAGIAVWYAAPMRRDDPWWRYVFGTATAALGLWGTLIGSAAATVPLAAGVAVVVGIAPAVVPLFAAAAVALSAIAAIAIAVGSARVSDSASVVVPVALGTILALVRREAAHQRRRDHQLHRLELTSAAADERTRIARDLHDVLAHSLGALVIQLDALAMVAAHEQQAGPQLVKRITDARGLAEDGLADARRAVHALRRFDDPVEDTLRSLADRLAELDWGELRVDVHGVPRIVTPAVNDALNQIAVEAVTNIQRHSTIGTATATVTYTDDRVTMRICNPVAPGPPTVSGHGLLGMDERARLVGGTFTAERKDVLWQLYCEVPGDLGRRR